jgi:DNA-directed RNA polymerase beta' subunit
MYFVQLRLALVNYRTFRPEMNGLFCERILVH